jgi:hypothetical protein
MIYGFNCCKSHIAFAGSFKLFEMKNFLQIAVQKVRRLTT